jgi:hypothetical protein
VFNKKKTFFISKLDLNVRKRLSEILHLEHNLVGAGTWTLRIIEKYIESFESFEMLCWKLMEKVSLSDSMRNEVLHGVKEERNILYTIKQRKANWIGHILPRN